jgi:hypothetical protein
MFNSRTSIQKFALIFGIVYALVGLLGFVPGVLQPPPTGAPTLQVDSAYGYLLGIFPVNALHSVVHLLVGLLGVVAARTLASARTYSRAVAVVFALLTIMGLVPNLNTTLGLIPLFGADVALHALTTLVAAYFGWFAAETRHSRAQTAAARG